MKILTGTDTSRCALAHVESAGLAFGAGVSARRLADWARVLDEVGV